MDFSKALEHLKKGQLLTREGWNKNKLYVYLNDPDNVIFKLKTPPNEIPWSPNPSDLIADDWQIVDAKLNVLLTGDILRYRHYKNQKVYQIVVKSKLESTKEEVITYRCLDDDSGCWTRPKEEFFGKTEDGTDRFKLILEG